MNRAILRMLAGLMVFGIAAGSGMAVASADAPAAAATGTLSIQAMSAGRDLVIRVNTLGAPPAATEAQPVWLVNDEGVNLTKLWVLPTGVKGDGPPGKEDPRCVSAPTHFVPIGPAPYTSNKGWCLEIRLPQHGSQVTGVLHGTSATITIMVEHQAAWGWPLFWASLGLLVALLVVLFSSAHISGLAPQYRLRRSIHKEAKKGAGDPTKIFGLTEAWRDAAKAAGQNVKSPRFVKYLADVVARGVAREDHARRRLDDTVKNQPGDSPLWHRADQEARRTTHDIRDFYDDRFRPRTLPADELNNRLARFNRAQAGGGFSGEPRASGPAPSLADDPLTGPSSGVAATEAVDNGRDDPHSRWGRGALEALVAFFALIPMFVAGGTALVSVYLVNKTFGTWTDYLGLMLATAGTAAATGVVAALLRGLAHPALSPPSSDGESDPVS